MRTIIRKSLPAAIAATLVAGALAIPAIAQPDDGTEDTTTESEADVPADHRGLPGPGGRFGPELEQGELAERLAEELGLDTETVQDAFDAVRADLAAERLTDAVEAGRMTQDQADRIAAALEEGDREAAREVFDEVRLEHLEERLAERVEAGEMTQEEADELLERAEEGDFPGRDGRRGAHGPGGRGGPGGPGAGGFDGPPADDADTTA